MQNAETKKIDNLSRKKLEEKKDYAPTIDGLSMATKVKRCFNAEHPGIAMFYYASMFLGDMHCTPANFDVMYSKAIKYAFGKIISGKVHYTETSSETAKTVEDVEHLMLECLRASGVKEETVKDFLKEEVLG